MKEGCSCATMSNTSIHTFAVLAYKESAYIEECIKSLMNQTVKSTIVITTSTPSSYLKAIADNFNLDLLVNPICGGIASDWNFALQSCQGKYITLAHQDDVYFPEYTQQCMSLADRHQDVLITFCDYAEIHNGNVVDNRLILAIKKAILTTFFPFQCAVESKNVKKMLLSFSSPIPCPSVMFNMEKLRDFSFSSAFQINLDWDAWLRIASTSGKFIYTKKRLMAHRIHAESETTSGINDNRRSEEDLRIFSSIWPQPIAKGLFYLYRLSYKSNHG